MDIKVVEAAIKFLLDEMRRRLDQAAGMPRLLKFAPMEAMSTRQCPSPETPGAIPKKQVRQIANSIRQFGFTNPVLGSDDGEIIAGRGRVMAARRWISKKSKP